jgi:4,5-DOPA dioxygenase extradiol
MTDAPMPAAFLGHGNPMNALDHNRYTEAWRAFGDAAAPPRAVLAVSAHWYINATAVTAMARPRTIHDFYGFPPELFAFDYPAPGDPELVAEVAETVAPVWVGADADSWGLDHGTWAVLCHVFPDADVPVVQLSIHATESFAYHVDLGRRLAPLRERGVMVVASGNVVHHLGRIDWSRPDDGFDWARRFDDAARTIMTTDPGRVLELVDHPDFSAAVPSPDHFLPLLYLAGLADASGETTEVLVGGCAFGSLSMTSFVLGATPPRTAGSPAPPLPDPHVVPSDDTNT